MSNTKIEMLRSACEAVENSEKVLAMALQHKAKFQSDSEAEVKAQNQVWWDMLVFKMAADIKKKSNEVISLYEDADGDFKTEQAVFAGHIRASDGAPHDADVWENFYQRLGQIDVSQQFPNQVQAYHSKYNSANDQASNENLEAENLFAQQMDAVLDQADKIFSGEESHGKYLDLHGHYMQFCNLKKLRQLNLIKSDDYLSWL